ncbi:MAG TPA: DUF3016 domain-containing protein, partial [Candidatus Didemnitutus sp.]|nr:DUF3016 domain-containing protein [Candidatus Didemnitutus sp.]
MNPRISRFLIPVAALGVVLGAALRAEENVKAPDQVTVIFSKPENFTDVSERFGDKEFGRDNLLARLKEHLEKKAVSYLQPGQNLTVTFTDIDLAGDFEPWWGVRSDEIRILREVYPPRMTLNFTLTDADGKIVKQGDRKIMDGAY